MAYICDSTVNTLNAVAKFIGFKSDLRLTTPGSKPNNDFKSNRGDVKAADACSHKTKY